MAAARLQLVVVIIIIIVIIIIRIVHTVHKHAGRNCESRASVYCTAETRPLTRAEFQRLYAIGIIVTDILLALTRSQDTGV